jgi:hypothetical protein
MKKNWFAFRIVVILLIFFSINSFAATRTTSQSGNWSASSTWGGNPFPTVGDDVIINGDFTVTIDIPNATCLSLQIGGSVLGQGTGTIVFTNGSQLSVSGAVLIGPENSNSTEGNVVMSNGGTLICEGIMVGRVGVWTPGTGTVELTASNVIPNDNTIIFYNLTISGGTTSIPRNVDVNGNILINNGAALDGGVNTLTVGGEWINNGTFNGNTGTVTFIKNGNLSIAGTGINNFNLIRVSLGANINNVLEVTALHFNAPDGFLTIINGTFKISGLFTFTNSFFTGPIYNIQPTAGFWINNPNVTVTAQAGGISVRGLLKITNGIYNIGTGIDHSLSYVDGSSIIIEGGELHIAGQLARNNSTQTTTYIQSGGVLTVVEQGSTHPTFAGFDLGVVGSSFTMSGGSIIIRNKTSAPADYLNNSSIANVTGGILQIGDANTLGNQTIRIQSIRTIGNLLVFNATAQLVSSSLNVAGNITIQPGKTFNANGLNLSLGGNWTNDGIFTGENTVTFNGTGEQTINRTGGETFSNLIINKPGGTLTQNNSLTITGALTLSNGSLSIGANTLNLNGNLSTTAGTLTGGTTSNIVISETGTAINLPPVTLNNLFINRTAGTTFSGDVTINGSASITNGVLNTNLHSLILTTTGTLSETEGQPVQGTITATRNITATTGTESFGNIGSEILLNGTAPGVTTVTRTTGTTVTGNGHNSIKRYFDISPTVNSDLNAGLVFHYDLTELNGQDAGTLEIYKSSNNGTTWNNFGGVANTTLKTITLNGINNFSRWTASDTANILGSTPVPLTISIDPSSKTVGDPGFILTVNGNDFVDGKSIVKFNDNDKSTTFISSSQLTASIPASDIQTVGSFPITVFNTGGGGSSGLLIFTVHNLPPAVVSVETAPDGSGTVVPAQSISSGSSITVYAITRDSLNNFLENVAADSWSLINISGGIDDTDIVPSSDNKSAVLTGRIIGTANIKSTSGSLQVTASGTITVTPGTAVKIRVETTSDGSGIIVPDDTLISGSSIIVYSISRDNLDNFIENIAADLWSLQNVTGGINPTDLTPAGDKKSALFTAHLAGSANIMATSGNLAPFISGLITVAPITGVENENQPVEYSLMQNYPNPFNPSTIINFSLAADSKVSLKVFNILGEEVATLVNGELAAGGHKIEFNASAFNSGVYLYRIEASGSDENKFVEIKKMILIK